MREGQEFEGKEAFVTGKYREEMEKMKKLGNKRLRTRSKLSILKR